MSVTTIEHVDAVEAEMLLTELDFETPVLPDVETPVIEPDEKPVIKVVFPKVAVFNWAAKGCLCAMCRYRPPEVRQRRMNRTAKALWVTALRSAKDRQGRGILRRNDRVCALGVLIEVAIENGVHVEQTIDTTGGYAYDGKQADLPQSVMEWAGLDRACPILTVAGQGWPIVVLNDEMGLPFLALADLVDAQL